MELLPAVGDEAGHGERSSAEAERPEGVFRVMEGYGGGETVRVSREW